MSSEQGPSTPAVPEPVASSTSPRLPMGGLLALSVTASVTLLTELLPAGVMLQMSASLNVSSSRVGFLATAYALASTAAAIPFTMLTRRLPRRPLLMALLAGLAIADQGTALSSSYLITVGIRLLAGLVNGMLWSMLASYAARMVSADQRGRAIAITLAGITVTLAAGVPAGTALSGLLGWRSTFSLLAVIAGVLIVWVRSTVPAVAGEVAGQPSGLLRIVRLPGIRPVLAVNGLLLLGHQTMYTYIAPFAARSGVHDTGLALLVFGVSAVVGIWITGTVVDRHLRHSLLAALALIPAAMLALGMGAHTVVLLVAVAVWGLAFGGAPTLLQTTLIDASGAANADVASSVQTTVYNAGIAGGSFVGGVVLDTGGAGALPWTALLFTAAAFIAAAAARRHGFPAQRPSISSG